MWERLNWKREDPGNEGIRLHDNPTEERASYDDEDAVSDTFLALFALLPIKSNSTLKEKNGIKDVRAHCYGTSLVRKLFIKHALPRHFQARAPS